MCLTAPPRGGAAKSWSDLLHLCQDPLGLPKALNYLVGAVWSS